MTRLWFCILLLSAAPAWATPLVADLSTYRINIDAGFTGTNLFLFGVRNDNGDVVAVIRGPKKDFVMRKKESIAGVWVNRDRTKFYNVPSFYAIASSKPLSDIEQTHLFSRLGIGEEWVIPPYAQPKLQEFSQAFLDYQREKKLYSGTLIPLDFMGETLFKTQIRFPDNIPAGHYTAEIYLINYGQIVGMQSMPIEVVKAGIDAALYHYAHHFPMWYGLSAIVIALAAGWVGGRLFERI